MTTTYLGGLSVAAAVPAVPLLLSAVGPLLAPQQAKIADIELRLAVPFVPPDPAAMLLALQSALAGLASSLASLPAADAAMRVSLGTEIAALAASLASTLTLTERLSAAVSAGGLHAWRIEAPAGQLAAGLSQQTAGGLPGGGGPSARAHALVIATESPGAWAALSGVLRT